MEKNILSPNIIFQPLLPSFCYYSNLIYRFCAAQTDIFSFVLFSSFLCLRSQPSFTDLYFETKNKKSALLILFSVHIMNLNQSKTTDHGSRLRQKIPLLQCNCSKLTFSLLSLFRLYCVPLRVGNRVRDQAWRTATKGSDFSSYKSDLQARSRSLTQAVSSISISIFVQRIGLWVRKGRGIPHVIGHIRILRLRYPEQ
jgi:hypothetical protein